MVEMGRFTRIAPARLGEEIACSFAILGTEWIKTVVHELPYGTPLLGKINLSFDQLTGMKLGADIQHPHKYHNPYGGRASVVSYQGYLADRTGQDSQSPSYRSLPGHRISLASALLTRTVNYSRRLTIRISLWCSLHS